MNSKIIWGLVIVFLSLFKFIPQEIMKYIVNYQVIMVLVGIYFLIKKKKQGWVFLCVGIYLYVTEFVWQGLPWIVIPLILGLVITGLGIKEVYDKKQLTKFSGKTTRESKDEEVVDAEEIQK